MKRRQIIVHFGIMLCMVLLIGTVSYVQAQCCHVDMCYKGDGYCGWEGCRTIKIDGDNFWEEVDATYSFAFCDDTPGGGKLCGYALESLTCAEFTTYTDEACTMNGTGGRKYWQELAECSEACN